MRKNYDEAELLASRLVCWLTNNSVASEWSTVWLSRIEGAFAVIAYNLLEERDRAERGKGLSDAAISGLRMEFQSLQDKKTREPIKPLWAGELAESVRTKEKGL